LRDGTVPTERVANAASYENEGTKCDRARNDKLTCLGRRTPSRGDLVLVVIGL
jgi:hypothetical protein